MFFNKGTSEKWYLLAKWRVYILKILLNVNQESETFLLYVRFSTNQALTTEYPFYSLKY